MTSPLDILLQMLDELAIEYDVLVDTNTSAEYGVARVFYNSPHPRLHDIFKVRGMCSAQDVGMEWAHISRVTDNIFPWNTRIDLRWHLPVC